MAECHVYRLGFLQRHSPGEFANCYYFHNPIHEPFTLLSSFQLLELENFSELSAFNQ